MIWEIRSTLSRNGVVSIESRLKKQPLKGDRIGLHLPNCPQDVIAFYAALSLGAVVVNINPMYTAGELKKAVTMPGVSVLLTLDLLLEPVRSLAQEVELSVVVTRITDFIKGWD